MRFFDYIDTIEKPTIDNIRVIYKAVNEKYDEGEIIFQESCTISPEDTYKDVARKVHNLEYAHFPRVIEEVILSNK